MPSLTVKIVNTGTWVFNTDSNQYESSYFGHMWYSIKESEDSAALSYGFAPVKRGDFDGPGNVNPHGSDDSNYIFENDDYSYTISITDEQFLKLKDFGDKPKENGFSIDYNGLKNSCIDSPGQPFPTQASTPTDSKATPSPPTTQTTLKNYSMDKLISQSPPQNLKDLAT